MTPTTLLRPFTLAAFLAVLSLFPGLSGVAGAAGEFTPVAGVWKTETIEGGSVLKVDGSSQAVPAREHFPVALHAATRDFREGTITVRFQPVAGKSDQAGGILFDRKENGDYLVVRANALENNLNLYRYAGGRRRPVKEVEGVPTAPGVWHELKVAVSGTSVRGYLDGALLLTYTLDRPVSGGVGLWSKDDSVIRFKDFRVEPKGDGPLPGTPSGQAKE